MGIDTLYPFSVTTRKFTSQWNKINKDHISTATRLKTMFYNENYLIVTLNIIKRVWYRYITKYLSVCCFKPKWQRNQLTTQLRNSNNIVITLKWALIFITIHTQSFEIVLKRSRNMYIPTYIYTYMYIYAYICQYWTLHTFIHSLYVFVQYWQTYVLVISYWDLAVRFNPGFTCENNETEK